MLCKVRVVWMVKLQILGFETLIRAMVIVLRSLRLRLLLVADQCIKANEINLIIFFILF